MAQPDRPQEIIRPNFGEARDNEIRKSLERVARVQGIEFAPGFEDYAAVSPKFEKELKGKVLLRFSRGKKAPGMSAKHFNESIGETPEGNLQNFEDFRESQGFGGDSQVVHIIGIFQGEQYQILEVSSESFEAAGVSKDNPSNIVVSENDPDVAESNQMDIRANFVFTRDPEIVLAIKPADCPIVIGFCKDKDGNDLIYVDHSGADAANAGLSYQGMIYLRDELGVNLSEVQIAIIPGVSKENFFITNEPERRGNGISEESWKDFIDEPYPDYIVEGLLRADPKFKEMTEKQKDVKRQEIRNGQKRYVDIGEATLWQLIDTGVLPENIQIIEDDSYEAAGNGTAHSHRYTMENDGKNRGRDVVMYQLLNNIEPIISEKKEFPVAA